MGYEFINSGIFWNPQKPKNWKNTRLKNVLHKEHRIPEADAELLICSNSGKVKHRGSSRMGLVAEDDSIYQGVHSGDLLIHGMDTWHGAIAVSKYDGMCTPVVHVCTSKTQNLSYIAYYMQMMANKKVFKLISNGVRQNTSDFRSWDKAGALEIILPPVMEQNQIVRYLDWQLSKINKLIHGYQRQIKLLEEKEKSTITYAVTHDRYCDERKKSEIYWLEDVPKSWHVTRLKHVLEKQKRCVLPEAELLICSNSGEVKLRGNNKLGLVADNEDIYQGVSKGDLLIHGMDTWHGAIAISNYDGMCTPVVHVCTSTQSIRFIYYYLRMMAFTKVFKAISNGVRQNTSDFRSWDKAGSLMIALPSLNEQEIIANYLDDVVERTKMGIAALQQQIELLKEYRTRLISDVVTGQKDVRDIVIPDYEPEENTIDEDTDDMESEVSGDE